MRALWSDMVNAKTPDGDRRLRMDDVAELAGVSQMTVSRALRTPEKVAPETRARIEAAMAQLDYVPDLVAGSLAARRSGLIAAVVSTFENAIFAPTIAGLTEAAEAAGFTILLGSSGYSETDEERLLRAILGRRPDGVMLTDAFHTPRARRLLAAAGVPIVETWDLPAEPVDMVVGFSNVDAGRAMALALHGFGYRRIAFVAPSSERDRRGLKRLEGYRRAMDELGAPRREIRLHGPVATLEEGAAALASLLDRHPDADAVACSVDTLAAGALLEARRRGIDVPGRLGIAGFGDFALAQPAGLDMTTMRIAGRNIGAEAGAMLVKRIAGETPDPAVFDIGYEVVRRSSA